MRNLTKLVQDRIQRRTAAKKTRLEIQTANIPTATAPLHVQQTDSDRESSLRYHMLLQEVRKVGAAVASLARRLDALVPPEDTSSVQRAETPELVIPPQVAETEAAQD